MAGFYRPLANALDDLALIQTRPVKLNPSLWPDCKHCGHNVNDCDCDPRLSDKGDGR